MECLAETIAVGCRENVELIVLVKLGLALVDAKRTYLAVCCAGAREYIDVTLVVGTTLGVSNGTLRTYRCTDSIIVNHLLDVQAVVANSHYGRVAIAIVQDHSHLVVAHIHDVGDVRVHLVDGIVGQAHGDIVANATVVNNHCVRIANLSCVRIISESTGVAERLNQYWRSQLYQFAILHLIATKTSLHASKTFGRSTTSINITREDAAGLIVSYLGEAIKALHSIACAIHALASLGCREVVIHLHIHTTGEVSGRVARGYHEANLLRVDDLRATAVVVVIV